MRRSNSGHTESLAQDVSSHYKQLHESTVTDFRCLAINTVGWWPSRERKHKRAPHLVSFLLRATDWTIRKCNPRECGIPAELKRCTQALEWLWSLGFVRQGTREEGTVQGKGTKKTSWEWSPVAPVQGESSRGLVENGCCPWESWAKIPQLCSAGNTTVLAQPRWRDLTKHLMHSAETPKKPHLRNKKKGHNLGLRTKLK